MMSQEKVQSDFRGSIVALITPFKDGKIDENALEQIVKWHIEQGTNGFVPCGTTGESPTLSHEEHRLVVEIVVETAKNIDVKVIAGTGSNSTQEALEFIQHAESVGADAALVVTPYYNKPTPKGLIAHFTALNDAVKLLPIFIYNIPARSVIDMSPETMAIVASLSNVVGVKDATGDLNRVNLQRMVCGPEFIQLSGEDATALGFNAQGGVGCISVTANIAPKLCAEFQAFTLAGQYEKALEIQDKLMPLHCALFLETSPAPIKYAAEKLGLCSQEVRLPLTSIEMSTKQAVDRALEYAELI